MNKERIAEIIYEQLSYAYCDNCRYALEIPEDEDRFSPCDECYRKYNNWGISMAEAKRIVERIENDEL